ncbi:Uncharacterised protein [Mycobacteroides abscessus subsp. abscessus]|nr:Uncharacterised protein [Mycobacteroides abscessus subsp. abscessus]SHW52774.1 Uncharacterised protein [Mycobacteroides abscessus subsp. abscessus]SIC47334.1 Uncharacterised protein [Mycobacteroides abscessus subsp. abscessus]SKV57263.1 Uncharacterised protein [Mycobacteroides abscessus subsp. abscessus]
MLVQYLVGLCALKWDSHSVNVDVVLGHMVPDQAAGSVRDVDVTVTVDTGDGLYAFKGYEVKNWSDPLNVNDVDGLVTKFNDMPAVTHRAIVSSTGYSETAIAKAEYHGIDLYQFKKWEQPLAEQFPNLTPMSGKPADHIRVLLLELTWVDRGCSLDLGVDTPPLDPLPPDAFLFDEAGKRHPTYPDFDVYSRAILLRSTEILCKSDPMAERAGLIRQAYYSGNPEPESPQWQHVHVLDVVEDGVFIETSDGHRSQIRNFTIFGYLKWVRLYPDNYVMEKVPTGEAFAGTIIAASQVQGRMWYVIFPAKGRDMSFGQVKLEKRHLNSIRNLQIALGGR